MSDISPTSDITLEDILDDTTAYNDMGIGSDVDYVEYDGNGDYHDQDQISFSEEIYYQTERGFGESFGWHESLVKSTFVAEVGVLSLSETKLVGLFRSDDLSLETSGEAAAGLGNGGFGQLGFGGLSNVSG